MNKLPLILFVLLLFAKLTVAQSNIDSLTRLVDKKSGIEKAKLLQSISTLYLDSDIKESIRYANQLLLWADSVENKIYISEASSVLGEAYFYLDDLDKSLNFFEMSLEARIKTGNKLMIAQGYNNLGIIASYKDYNEALEYYKKAEKINKEIDNYEGLSSNYNNIGVIYEEDLKDYKNALIYYEKSHELEIERKSARGIVISLNNIGDLYRKWKKYEKADHYYQRSLKMADSLYLLLNVKDVYEDYYEMSKAKGNFKNALEFYEKVMALKDSANNIENQKQISELEVQYKTDKQKSKILLQQQQIGFQQIGIYAAIVVLIIIISFSILLMRENIKRKKANHAITIQNAEISEKSEEIRAQAENIEMANTEITEQNKIIAKKNKDTTSSITYAQRIQNALLPPVELIDSIFKENFILYLPKDIVSGDFYWIKKINDTIIWVIADCTGHGVPGGFMSMLGISFLNEIVERRDINSADKILNELRNQIKKSLRQTSEEGSSRDGMDMALCVINTKDDTLQFAGANNPVYIIRTNTEGVHELHEIKADRMPIGFYPGKIKNFTAKEFKLRKGDRIYTFSDGYIDQFGQESGRKYIKSRFKKLLLDVQNYNMEQQYETIHKEFIDWKGDLPQIDDVVVGGVVY